MRALLASPFGFLIGLSLGALGAGGSILAVPTLVYVAGQSPRDATTTSLLFVGTAAFVGAISHLRAGRVRVRTGLLFGLTGVGGALAGTALNRRLDPDVLLLGFSVLVAVAAWRMLVGCPTCTRVGEARAIGAGRAMERPGVATGERLGTRRVLAVLAAGTAVGFLAGLFGVGGGFVVVPALTLVLHMPMPDAIGTSLLVITVNAAVALALRLGSSTLEWSVALPFTVAAVIGVVVGSRLAGRLDPERSLRWFAALLVCVALATATQSIMALAT